MERDLRVWGGKRSCVVLGMRGREKADMGMRKRTGQESELERERGSSRNTKREKKKKECGKKRRMIAKSRAVRIL